MGLTEAEFWDQTPYLTHLAIRARGKRAFEAAMMAGWMSERFAREERLSGLLHYMAPQPPSDADDGDALIASWGMMHGLTVEEVDEPQPEG